MEEKYNVDALIVPDSSNSRDIGHFYISIPQSDNEPSFYDCKKCHNSGIVTYQKLLEWSLFDPEMAIELTIHNKNVLSNPGNIKYCTQNIYNINNLFITDDKVSEIKLNYINNRLGLNFDYKDILANKIVLNINDLLKSNHINKYTRHQNIINELDSSFLGFISFDNAFINMRNLAPGKVYKGIDKKYINYSIFDKQDNTCKFYINPCELNITNSNPIKVHIGEGPFDALSIKYNLRKEYKQSIYAAITGSGYKGLIRYIITNLKLMNLEIHIYADSDIDRWIILDLANFLSVYRYPFYLHRNTIGKDMGVRIDQINESIEKLI